MKWHCDADCPAHFTTMTAVRRDDEDDEKEDWETAPGGTASRV
jgi:hypothetical protein